MQFARRTFLGVTAAAALALAVPARAQTAGKDYTPVSPTQPTDDPAKIEVLEFFSYGCQALLRAGSDRRPGPRRW